MSRSALLRVLTTAALLAMAGAPLPAAAAEPPPYVVELQKKAAQGDAVAMLNLGFAYQFGSAGAPDPKEALRWFRRAAEAGSPQAQSMLGKWYLLGEGVPKNPQEAERLFAKVAAAGDAESLCEVGGAYAEVGSPEQAEPWLARAVQSGSTVALETLAGFHDDGKLGKKDPQRALALYLEAARKGSAVAQHRLCKRYIETGAAPEALKEALGWCQARVDSGRGDADLLHTMSLMAERNQAYETAYKWSAAIMERYAGEISVAHEGAALSLLLLEKVLSPEQRARATADAQAWVAAHADKLN